MTCPVCGTVPVPGANFCHHCGAALAAAATLPATERRVVTVLFGDLSDFTAWSEGVDPERVGAVTDRVMAALAGAVKTFGGHVDKLTGDGIMAVFGAPVAHEDDGERAVRAALAMQRAVRRVLDDERGGGAPGGLRLGLNTGVVVAGVQAGLEYTVIGDTVNTAARLADAASIGSTYAGAVTSAATRHVASWRWLRPLRLKGKRDPVEAYELLGLVDSPGTRSGMGDEAPFVGRETELGIVSSRLAEVADRGEPRVVVFTAEAGLGKSRFAAEAARVAAGYDRNTGGGARVLTARCAAYGERRRLAPLADLVRAVAGLPAEPNPAATRAGAEDRLRRFAQLVERRTGVTPKLRVDLLLTLLGYGDGVSAQADRPGAVERPGGAERPSGTGDVATERADAEREAMAAAVGDLISAAALESPIVVIVDDLHDATPQTIEALGVTLRHLRGPALVLLMARPELVRNPAAMSRLADAEVYPISPLRGAEAARLLTAYLGGGKLPQADQDRLLLTAQGNPFYLVELVTMLIERGTLTATGARSGATHTWRLSPESLGGRLLSRDLAAVLAARIDALPAVARAVLRDAAVVGDEVPAAALEALRDGRVAAWGGLHRGEARPGAVVTVELDRAVDELLHRRMLLRVHGGYAFATPLMREAAYAGVGKADLAERHALLAAWAAQVPSPVHGWSATDRDSFIAGHGERASTLADAMSLRADAPARAVVPLAVAAWGRLARTALVAGEPARAAQLLDQAAAMAGDDFSPDDRFVLANALLQLGRAKEALVDAEKIIADGVDPALRARGLLTAGLAHRALGEPERADDAWRGALAVATAADVADVRAEVLRRIGMTEYLRGRLGEAATLFAKALEISETAGDRTGQAWSLQYLAWVTTTRGDFLAADQAINRATRIFAELGDVTGRAWVRGTSAFARLLAGRLTEARRLAHAFLPFGDRVGDDWAVGTLRAVGAFAAAELGDLSTADAEARRAYGDFSEAADEWGMGFALVVRGVVARGLDEPGHAHDLLTDALRHGERTGHPLLIGMARTIRGFVSLSAGDAAAAEADARATLAVIESHDVDKAATVGPRVLLGAARLAVGDVANALDLLEAVASEVDSAATRPALIFSRRQVLSTHAEALLAAGRPADAVASARRAVELPAEDVRSRVLALRVLAASLAATGADGEPGAAAEAEIVARQAVAEAYATQQASERRGVDAVLAAVSSPAVA
ncbi:hypothetical protein GCM10009682_08880 [Luedemannella flava]|uniref:Guanylate cyclase domain-containing protein n=1 Tax=Luedemannella flava TaxID=349316 RepID=A0ABN2LI87_9ACTN